MEQFSGNLILGIGLNNALKANSRNYRDSGDPIKQLENLIDTINELLPNAKFIYFIRPIEVPIWADNEDASYHCYQAYGALAEKVTI